MKSPLRLVSLSLLVAAPICAPYAASGAGNLDMAYEVDPITRHVQVSYRVPPDAGDSVQVVCTVRPVEQSSPEPAAVRPHISETAQRLIREPLWHRGIADGVLVELRAAGLRRALWWDPFQLGAGDLDVEFIISIEDRGRIIATDRTMLQLRNGDVILIDDWSGVLQSEHVSPDPEPGQEAWWLRPHSTAGRPDAVRLGVKEKSVPLPQLTYPLDLNGHYAAFVRSGQIELRFTGDDLYQHFSGIPHEGTEVLWCWRDMAFQSLVVRQPYRTIYPYYEGDGRRASLDHVRLVPLTDAMVAELEEQWRPLGDKRLVVGYDEPYTWAFYRNIQSSLDHLEPVQRFSQANVDIIDIQAGRPGSLMNYETRVGEQHLWSAMGDGLPGQKPFTPNVGRMQQYTNMLETQVRYALRFGMSPHMNLGATICYIGETDESQFSKDHPEWRDRNFLKYSVPEVREYVLAHFREGLELGAEGISVDWTRYPYSIRRKETVTDFFRELRALADEFSAKRQKPVKILTRFSVPDSFWDRGEDRTGLMDYATWCREGLVDYICPSYYNDRLLHFPLDDYLAAVKGTDTMLIPCVGFVELPMPGMWLARVRDCYEQGVDGIYIYQMEGLVCDDPPNRRYASVVHSAEWVRQWHRREQEEQPRYSKRIYVKPASRGKYRDRERLRVWIEGVSGEVVELFVDGELMNRYESPPYVLTSEYQKDDDTITPGMHRLRVRARDGQGWLEQGFDVEFDVH